MTSSGEQPFPSAQGEALLADLLADEGSRWLGAHMAAGGTFATFAERWLEIRRHEAMVRAAVEIRSVISNARLFRGLPGLTWVQLAKQVQTPYDVHLADVLSWMVAEGELETYEASVRRWKLPDSTT